MRKSGKRGKMNLNDYKSDLEFLYSELMKHPAFIRNEKDPEEFLRIFEKNKEGICDLDSFVDALTNMVMFFEDGHTNIELPYTSDDRCLNLKCGWNEKNCDELLVEEGDGDIPQGARILKIEDTSIEELINRSAQWIPHENIYLVKSRMVHYPYRNYHLFSEMNLKKLFGAKEKYAVDLLVNGEKVTKSFALENYNGVADFIPDEEFLSYEVQGDKIIMHLNSCICNDEYRNTLRKMAELCTSQNIKTFVLDLSKNMGGDSSVIGEFLEYTRARRYRLYEMTDYSSGEEHINSDRDKEIENKKQNNLFPRNMICKISHDTFSSARTFAITLLDNGIAKICGLPMGGCPNSYGMPRKTQLPNSKIRFRVSRAYFRRPDSDKDNENKVLPIKTG